MHPAVTKHLEDVDVCIVPLSILLTPVMCGSVIAYVLVLLRNDVWGRIHSISHSPLFSIFLSDVFKSSELHQICLKWNPSIKLLLLIHTLAAASMEKKDSLWSSYSWYTVSKLWMSIVYTLWIYSLTSYTSNRTFKLFMLQFQCTSCAMK